MLNETDYYALYLAKLKGQEMRDFFEIENRRKEPRQMNKNESRGTIVTLILEGAGNALVATGNKLLRIA